MLYFLASVLESAVSSKITCSWRTISGNQDLSIGMPVFVDSEKMHNVRVVS